MEHVMEALLTVQPEVQLHIAIAGPDLIVIHLLRNLQQVYVQELIM